MKLLIEERRKEIDNIFSYIFQPEEPVTWQAGQYALYRIPHDNPDNRGEVRIFTVSSPPFKEKLMLTTHYLFEESSSFKKALFAKKVGDEVELVKIDGKFTINNDAQKLVFIAGGIGITPFHSILLELEKEKVGKDIILIYSNKDEEHIVFKDTLDNLARGYNRLNIKYIFSPQRADENLIKETVPVLKERVFYISGPMRLVKAVEETLYKLEVDKENVKKDYFPGLNE
ncbi:MAG TPA: FAD-dependent oxidoreductase [Atribacterota bacterium]|nr:FAD-dependent oxidoreductase [Atribacterota bacterium]